MVLLKSSQIVLPTGHFHLGKDVPALSVQQLLDCDRAINVAYGVGNLGCAGGYFQVSEFEAHFYRILVQLPLGLQSKCSLEIQNDVSHRTFEQRCAHFSVSRLTAIFGVPFYALRFPGLEV